jgi:hypothetical protein
MSLKVLEGEKMRKGRFVEGNLVIACCVLLGLSVFIYLNKEDTEAKRGADNINDVKLAVKALDGKITEYQDTTTQYIEKLRTENKAVTEANIALLNDLNHRVGRMEKTSDTPKNVNVSFAEPLKVSVVYRQATKKPLIPTRPIPDAPKTLLERAGVTNQ